MSQQQELRLAGLGGQGIILAGIIMAEAAGIYDGKFVAQTQAYGAAARGGFSRSDIVISDEEINYPKARELDMLLAMSQDAYEENLQYLTPRGIFNRRFNLRIRNSRAACIFHSLHPDSQGNFQTRKCCKHYLSGCNLSDIPSRFRTGHSNRC